MDDIIRDEVIPNVAKATKQELMDGYRMLLKKYQGQAASEPAAENKQKQIFDKLQKYQSESDITQAVASVRSALSASLADIEGKFTAKFSELKALDEDIAQQNQSLKERYEIESAAGSFMALLQAKEEAKRQAEQEKLELEQKRKRDEEEYKFSLELLKRKDKEAFEAEKRAREIDLQAQEVALAEQQKAFAAKEAEFARLQQETAEFPSRLETEQRKVTERLTAEAAKDKEMSLLFAQKEREAQVTVFEGRVQSLESLIEEQKRVMLQLQEQLKASQSQVQEVVLKSIEGASGAKTLDVVNKLAFEQTRANIGQR